MFAKQDYALYRIEYIMRINDTTLHRAIVLVFRAVKAALSATRTMHLFYMAS